MRRPRTAVLASLVALLAAVLVPLTGTAAASASSSYAPLNRPGPALSVSPAKLRAALVCSGNFRHPTLEPVLLNPATGVTAEQNYSWNYERAFTAQGRPWCAVTMPHSTLIDIQTSAEYLVHSIRHEYGLAGRRIAVMGHSQGGMSMRWALRFWPDTRAMVDDVIGMSGSNHGTTVTSPCVVGLTNCVPAVWQQGSTADFIAALNSRAETFHGISYTEIYTHTDEVVQPNGSDGRPASAALSTGDGAITNVATQDLCPGDVYEHLLVGTVDPVAYALVMDALTHRGPAKLSRIDSSVCSQVYQPGVDPLNAQNEIETFLGLPGLLAVTTPDVNLVGAPEVPREPALRCYVFADGC
jgi:pimeloyl-ACP methyl ester carboxylesterase